VKLKSLRLFGFKTFAEQTVLTLEPGISAVVGPNGSGKSNLVDAIRWVLGEQHPKSLRSTKTEDVIFAGNDKRKPLGMAEVSLTFDNEDRTLAVDFAEVQITRRAYRAGESEFYINRQHVRMRDVIDLFMGTGLGPGSYAIVSQGQIDAVLAEKPTERRGLFEETAGISKFLARKAESMRRLEQTEQNGIRVNDLLEELNKRIPELETQVRRAKRYRRASARLRDLEILTYLRSTADRRVQRELVGKELERAEAARIAAGTQGTQFEAGLAALRAELYAGELRLEEKRGEATAQRAALAEIEAQHAALGARREALLAQSAATSDDRERRSGEREDLERSLADLDARITPALEELERRRTTEAAAQAALAEARAELDRVFTALRELEAGAVAAAASEAERRANLQALQADIDRLEREASASRELSVLRLAEAGERERWLHDAAAAVASLEGEVAARSMRAERADARVVTATENRAATQDAYLATTSALAGAEARLHTVEELEANLEGHIPGTRAILEAHARGDVGGVVGVVSNLVHVEEQYARALDIAFGTALSNIVTATAEDAERAIAYLSARELGRATFLPLDVLASRTGRDPASAPNAAGVVGYAHTLVRTDPAYAGIVAFLVGRILIVRTLRDGVELVRGRGFRDTVVTLDGDQISGGAMTGGRYKRERAILSRRAQAETLRAQIPDLRDALSAAAAAAEAATGDYESAARERDEARELANAALLKLRDAQTTAEAVRREAQRLANEGGAAATTAAERDAHVLDARTRFTVLERPPLDAPARAAEREELETALAAARERIAHAQEHERAVAAEIGAARESAGALVAQRDAERVRLALLDADHERAAAARERMALDLEDLARKLEAGETALADARGVVRTADAGVESLRGQRDAMGTRAAALEGDLRVAQTAERSAGGACENARVRLAEIDAEIGMLAAAFAQNPATAEECADVEARYVREEGDFAAEVARLREELNRLSNVNLNAEAERDELAQRETFLREQLEDLAKARETLLASIREIELTSQEQFNEMFAQVKRAFEETFPRLFPGGEAKMWQTNPDSLSETGIELSVQPPGKRMTALALLSGGERAMTAAALIFALIQVRPSPFYLLDEVDAALDDANVERFSAMVRELSGAAQILLVTHNKKTMELASRMYGVTMAEPGVSSIIAADLDRADVAEPALAG
jgi:chromosome segregation protein